MTIGQVFLYLNESNEIAHQDPAAGAGKVPVSSVDMSYDQLIAKRKELHELYGD